MADEEIITSEDAEESLEEVINETTKETNEAINRNAFLALQEAAKIFLKTLTEIQDKYEQDMKKCLETNVQNLSEEQITKFKDIKNRLQTNRIRNRYLAAFTFDKELTKFKGEVPKKAIFVYNGPDGIPKSIEMPLEELVNYMDRHGRIYQNVSALITDTRKELEESMREELNAEHIKQARSAYAGTVNRMNRYWETHNETSGQKHKAILMWKINRDWVMAEITNLGVVKEGYVNALMLKHKSDLDKLCGISTGDYPYYSHELINVFFENHLKTVTSLAAIVEEDVVTDEFQYAVKGHKASAPGMQQYIKTAQELLKKNTILTPSEVKEMIKNMFPKQHHLAVFKGIANNTVQETLSDVINGISTGAGSNISVKEIK